jgi:hypothetical protein
MPSNTACRTTRPINFANISVEKRDPFTVVDGRYIGHDGFVVPRNFDEFYDRYPEHVRNWVRKHAARSTPIEDVEDWTQDLLIHLKYLPATSKFRADGREDIVQTFDPKKHHGANGARFFNFINLCLTNKFRAMYSKRIKNPICRPGNASFEWEGRECDHGADEFWQAHSEYLRRRFNQQERQQNANHALREFCEFTKRKDSSVLRTLQAIAVSGTSAAAADLLGTTQHEVCRTWSRLRTLGRCFQNGEPVPKPPRRYTRRVTPRITVSVP